MRLLRLPPSVSSDGGHDDLVRAAEGQAFSGTVPWGTKCRRPDFLLRLNAGPHATRRVRPFVKWRFPWMRRRSSDSGIPRAHREIAGRTRAVVTRFGVNVRAKGA